MQTMFCTNTLHILRTNKSFYIPVSIVIIRVISAHRCSQKGGKRCLAFTNAWHYRATTPFQLCVLYRKWRKSKVNHFLIKSLQPSRFCKFKRHATRGKRTIINEVCPVDLLLRIISQRTNYQCWTTHMRQLPSHGVVWRPDTWINEAPVIIA